MTICHDTVGPRSAPPTALTVALAGNPNSGKTTIFNALTGLRQKTGNYPGVTVERKTGRCRLPDGTDVTIVDLPGTYSLISRSPDEVVAMQVLRGLRPDTPVPDAVIVVVDASNLQRNLYLVSQLVELGRPMVVALNMTDVAARRGLNVSAERLAAELGVPVVPIVGHKRRGVPELKAAIRKAVVAPSPDWPLPAAMKTEVRQLATLLDADAHSPSPGTPGEGGGEGDFGLPVSFDSRGNPHPHRERGPDHAVLAERLLVGDRSDDLQRLSQAEPIHSHLSAALGRLHALGIDPVQADIEAHYHWIDTVAAGAMVPACAALVLPATPQPLDYARPVHLSERVDRILVHKVWGLLIFAAVMAALFVSIFWLAAPVMDAMQKGIAWLGTATTSHLGDGPLKDLLNQGVFAGVGTVVVFVPQIALLFFFLAILEDSGYLARAAFLMDRLLSKVGLHGKSFIPLLSSFACAIPGIMAARTIENRKDRLATILVAPFMSCSARLPVYTLLIGTFFARYGAFAQAGIMLACYALGILAAVGTALVFKRTFLKGMPSSFILEMPSYKLPQVSLVARQVWTNASQFLKKAGTTIFAMSVVLWALAYYPRLPAQRAEAIKAQCLPEARYHAFFAPGTSIFTNPYPNGPSDSAPEAEKQSYYAQNFGKAFGADYPVDVLPLDKDTKASFDKDNAMADSIADDYVAAAQSEYSFAGRFGHLLEPVIRPLGYDWKMGVGLVGAFAARETFVSTEGIIYATGGDTDAGTANLSKAMTNARYADGRTVWTPLVAVSLLIWFVLAMQCMSTVAIVRRETGGWGWPIFMTAYMNGLAYIVCLLVFQIGSHLHG